MAGDKLYWRRLSGSCSTAHGNEIIVTKKETSSPTSRWTLRQETYRPWRPSGDDGEEGFAHGDCVTFSSVKVGATGLPEREHYPLTEMIW